MITKWSAKIEDKQHIVEVRYGSRVIVDLVAMEAGELLVDDRLVERWDSSIWGPPKEICFQIGNKKAVLRRRGILHQNLELLVPGLKVTRIK